VLPWRFLSTILRNFGIRVVEMIAYLQMDLNYISCVETLMEWVAFSMEFFKKTGSDDKKFTIELEAAGMVGYNYLNCSSF